MAKLFSQPTYQALDANGDAISGARLFFYLTGTSTKHDTYTDNALSVAHANPVVADSAGRFAPIYLQDADYKVVLAIAGADDPPTTPIQTIDPVHGAVGIGTATLAKSTDYTVLTTDKGSIILVDASGGEVTITLLAAVAEFIVGVKKTDSSANKVIVDGDGAETIDGQTTFEIEAQYDAVNLRADASSWHVVSDYDEFPPATASKTAGYEVVVGDNGRTILVDASTVTFDAGIQEDNSGGPSFVDETTDLNSAAANDVALFPAGAGVDDAFYFGMTGKFAGLNMNVGTAGAGTYTVNWEYWNGSWASLSGVVDGTSAFQTAGANDVSFQVPADWATTTINSQGPFYYIRARRDAGTVTTDPLGTQGKVFTTVLLPPAATARNGFDVSVKKTDSSVNAVTVAASAAETINGDTTQLLTSQYASEIYECDGSNWFAVISPLETRTPITTTSGTAHDFLGIRASAKRITIMFNGVSLSVTDNILVQVGDVTSFEATGYASSSGALADASQGVDDNTTGFVIRSAVAANTVSGQMVLTLASTSNLWISSHACKLGGNVVSFGGGDKTLTGTLTRVRVTRDGTDTFDAGSVNILIE